MSRYLLLVSLGPVQGFIATARRTRDLYAGSRLLSETAGAVAKYLIEQDAKLIFPAVETAKDLGSLIDSGIPNVIQAIVTANDAKQLTDIAEKAEDEARSFLKDKAEEIFSSWDKSGVLTRKDAALAQVADMLEFYWAAAPLNEKGDYLSARERVGRALGARKNTRNFGPVTWGGPVPKSSLSGDLESVTYEASDKEKLDAGLRKGEELSGVDLLKRLRKFPFPSTSHMAALPFLIGLESKREALWRELGSIAQKYVEKDFADHSPVAPGLFKKLDPRLLFPSRYTEFVADQNALQEMQSEAAGIFKKYGEPYPYYAILHADGDRMGKAIDAQKSPDDHRRLSRRLNEFAQSVKGTVNNYSGSLVYAGGDDVLALLPLHTALDCAKRLADEFKSKLKGFEAEGGQTPTLSVGLAVVHHLYDLGDALNLARKAEKEAKKTRNALAVIFSPRSGAETVTSGGWSDNPPLTERLRELATLLNESALPRGFAYELRETARVFENMPSAENLLALEAERILKRKETGGADVEKKLKGWLTKFGAERLSAEIIVARAFAKSFDLAKTREEAPI